MFLVIELQTNDDGTMGNFVWAFETENEAFAKFHTVLSAAAVSTLPVHSCTILRNDGMQIAAQYYKHGD